MEAIVLAYKNWHTNNWCERMWSIARKEVELFEDHSIEYADNLIHQECRRSIMLMIYNHLVRYKGVTPIEKLDKDTKEKMWLTIKEICAGKTDDTKRMIEIAKTFYTIEYFLNEPKQHNRSSN